MLMIIRALRGSLKHGQFKSLTFENSVLEDYFPKVCATPILVIGSVIGLFPLHNGVLLMFTINQTPLGNGETFWLPSWGLYIPSSIEI